MLDRDAIVSQLNSDRYAVSVVGQTVSTNTDLRALALTGAAEGTTLIADTQTGGRGRRGRTFASPEGGVYLSTLLRPAPNTKTGLITCLAAVAACRAIESLCSLWVEIKWVNDLYLNGRKVAGILAEGVLAPDGTLSAVVIGIGINVYGTLPPELSTIATTLEREGVTRIGEREHRQAQRCVSGLEKLGMTVFAGPHQAGTLSFLPGADCEEFAQTLAQQGVAVRAGLHCAPLAHESAGTLGSGTVRISFGYDASDAQCRRLLSAVYKGKRGKS